MRLLDSRRLTGASVLLDRPGAVVDVALDPADRDRAIAAWRDAVTRMLAAVGWGDQAFAARAFQGGASLGFTAPSDALYAATEVNEWAWSAAEAELAGATEPDFGEARARLATAIAEESNPPLLAMRAAARDRGVSFLAGEEVVSVGSGIGVVAWPERAIPRPAEVDWSRVSDIPIALVTGSNGKTTVVRLLAAMAAEAGRVTGSTTTDGVAVAGRFVAEGDFSGPSGARMLLRRREVETAVLETARGGLLRRGLAVERAAAAVVTNVAADHLGEFGVEDLPALAQTKLLVARAVERGGRLVLNADDRVLVETAARVTGPVAWFSLHPANRLIDRHVRHGGVAAVLRDNALTLLEAREARAVVAVADLPIALGGGARYNLANALAALAAAGGLGIPDSAARAALVRFGRDPGDNPGRANLIELGGAQLFLDYVHNPHGMAALAEALDGFAGGRRLVMLGQAGDRDDESIRALARSALALRPDRVVVKEMDAYLRGRARGEVPGIIAGELRSAGLAPEAVTVAASEPAGVRAALAWARPGDLLVLAVHQDRRAVLDLMDSLRRGGWRAGDPVPDPD